MSATTNDINNIKPEAALVFNFIDSDALLPTIRKLLSYLGYPQTGSRNECLRYILKSLISMSLNEITLFEAYSIKLIMEKPRKNGKFINASSDFPERLHWKVIDTIECATDFIEEIEACTLSSLSGHFSNTISRKWKEEYELNMTDNPVDDDSDMDIAWINNFDWSIPVRKPIDRSITGIPLECQCTHPNRRKLVTNEPLPPIMEVSEKCECIHCFLHNAFPLDRLERCAYCISTNRVNYYSQLGFDLSEEEDISMFVVSRLNTTWKLSDHRFRILVNNVEIFAHQSIVQSNNYSIGRFVHQGYNTISICSDLPPYLYIVFNIHKYFSIPQFIEDYKNLPIPPLEESKKQFLQLIDNDDDLDVDDAFQFSLLDPLSRQRMAIPVRSTQCQHLPCFDLSNFLELYGMKEKMMCPVCNKQIYCDDLKKDFFVMSILDNTSEDQDEVKIKSNGEWEVVVYEEKSEDEEEEELAREEPKVPAFTVEQLENRFIRIIASDRQRKRPENTNIEDFFGRRRQAIHEPQNIIRLPVVMNYIREEDLSGLSPPPFPNPQPQLYISSQQQSQPSQKPIQQPQQRQVQQHNNDDEIINLVSDSDSSQDVQPRNTNNIRSDYIIDISNFLVCLHFSVCLLFLHLSQVFYLMVERSFLSEP